MNEHGAQFTHRHNVIGEIFLSLFLLCGSLRYLRNVHRLPFKRNTLCATSTAKCGYQTELIGGRLCSKYLSHRYALATKIPCIGDFIIYFLTRVSISCKYCGYRFLMMTAPSARSARQPIFLCNVPFTSSVFKSARHGCNTERCWSTVFIQWVTASRHMLTTLSTLCK